MKTLGTYGTMYFVKDMKAAVVLQREKLGFKPSYESEHWTEFSFNGHSLCLHWSDSPEDLKKGGILIIRVSGLNEWQKHLKDHGVDVSKEITEVSPGAYSLNYRDLDGNTYSLYEDARS